MISRSTRTILLGALAGTLAWPAGATISHACAPLRHSPTRTAPTDGESMPASAPGILVTGEESASLEVFDAEGFLVEGTFLTSDFQTYFAPSAPLKVGTYTLRYLSYEGRLATEAVELERTITVTPAVPAPTATGDLRVAEVDRTEVLVGSAGSCYAPADAAILRLELDPDDSFAPYGSVVAWETRVDGELWASSEGTLAPSTEARSVLSLFAACDNNGASGRDPGLSPGVHDVELQPTLVGSGIEIPPARIRVMVSCRENNGTTFYGTGALPPPGSGCAATPNTSAPGSFGVLGLLGLAILRRRRSRSVGD